jgi:molybdopterin synthase catalytic subunit
MSQQSFQLHAETFDPREQADALADPAAGGYCAFEGWVRNHNEGKDVRSLEYEAYPELAHKEGQRILDEAREQFDILGARCIHRTGHLQIGEIAVWVGATAKHREDAFAACRHIIDQVKARVPIWKKEHYADGDSGWVRCEHCAAHGHPH